MLFKAKENVWKVKRNDEGKLAFEPIVEFEKIAVFGVRPCDLRGIEIQIVYLWKIRIMIYAM